MSFSCNFKKLLKQHTYHSYDWDHRNVVFYYQSKRCPRSLVCRNLPAQKSHMTPSTTSDEQWEHYTDIEKKCKWSSLIKQKPSRIAGPYITECRDSEQKNKLNSTKRRCWWRGTSPRHQQSRCLLPRRGASLALGNHRRQLLLLSSPLPPGLDPLVRTEEKEKKKPECRHTRDGADP